MPVKPVFMTYAEVSEIVGLNRVTISRMVARGEFLAPIYLGKNPRWHRDAFETWLAAFATGGDTQTAA